MSAPNSPQKSKLSPKNKISKSPSPKSPKIGSRLFNESPSINRFQINRTKNRMSNSKKTREDMRILFHETDQFESFHLKTSFNIPIEITPNRPIIAMNSKIKTKSKDLSQSSISNLPEKIYFSLNLEKPQTNEQEIYIEKVQNETVTNKIQQKDEKEELKEYINEEEKPKNDEIIQEKTSNKNANQIKENNELNEVNEKKLNLIDQKESNEKNENDSNINSDYDEENEHEIKLNLFSDDDYDFSEEDFNDHQKEDFNHQEKNFNDQKEDFNDQKEDFNHQKELILKNGNSDLFNIEELVNENNENNVNINNDTSIKINIIEKVSFIETNFENFTISNLEPFKNNFEPELIQNHLKFDKSSIRYNVQKNGGNINGVLRFSIQWNDTDEWDQNDLDAHCIEPNGNIIMYNNKASPFSRGILDIDVTDPEPNKPACENITWPSLKKMKRGVYRFLVHNYEYRNGHSGFRAEIQMKDEIFSYDYRKTLKNKENVIVAEVTLVKNQFYIKHFLDYY